MRYTAVGRDGRLAVLLYPWIGDPKYHEAVCVSVHVWVGAWAWFRVQVWAFQVHVSVSALRVLGLGFGVLRFGFQVAAFLVLV